MSHATPHRLLYFFVAFVLLMFFGLIYAWSLFVDPLEAEFGWDRSATSVVFTLSIITFCAGMLVAGALEERTSPRTVMLITAACLGLGGGGCRLWGLRCSLSRLNRGLGHSCGLCGGLRYRYFCTAILAEFSTGL